MEWFKERYVPGFAQTLEIKNQILQKYTKYQKVELFESTTFGKVFVLDDIVQCTELDEYVNHEMLAHIPIFSYGDPRSVLIVGGGDGGVLEEVLKHNCINKVKMVDIDSEVVDIAKTHLRSICGNSFENSRTDLIVADAIQWVATSTEQFDVIILDRPDPVGPAVDLFSKQFYINCAKLMSPQGIIVAQSGILTFHKDQIKEEIRLMREVWKHCGFYISTVPTYAGGLSAHAWAANWDIRKANPAPIHINGLKYYNEGIHNSAFVLPNFAQELLK
jgi:spermidine synthase